MILETPAEPGQRARFEDGRVASLPLLRWFGPPPSEEREVLALARAPVLDVGCGPARHALALRRVGVEALGVDISPGAVEVARRRGARAICRSVFDPLPREGGWGTILLLDGNVGIGGSPMRLLRRARSLLRPGGIVLAELEPPGIPTRALRVRIEVGSRPGAWQPWAQVGADVLPVAARSAGLLPRRTWTRRGRWFASLIAP